jgi:RNA polymerase sigma-70 factor (ECF subfamily)
VTHEESELIARVLLHDDRDAFGELVRRHQSAVRNFLRHLSHGDGALADDLAQETFIHAYRRLGQFRGASSFVTWLLGIAHNHHRNARRRQKDVVALDESHAEESSGISGTLASDLRYDLAEALRELPVDEQLAVHLCYQQGLSHSEIAAVTDWPLGTVKTHLARSKEKLRTLLAAWNPQP